MPKILFIWKDERENLGSLLDGPFVRHSGQVRTGVRGKSRNPVGPASEPVGQASCLSDGLEARPTKTYGDAPALLPECESGVAVSCQLAFYPGTPGCYAFVIPAKAGIQRGYTEKDWIPAFAGMTDKGASFDLCHRLERALALFPQFGQNLWQRIYHLILGGGTSSRNPFSQVFLSFLLCFFGFLLVFSPSPAQCKLYLDLENPNLAKIPIAVPDFVGQGAGPINGRDLARIIKNDLYLTGLFQIVEEAPPRPQNPGDPPDFDGWSETGAQALILGNFQVRGDELVLEAMLYDVALKKLELGKRFSGRINDHRIMIHKFGDRVMEKLTNIPGCFTTQIAFVSDGQSRELFIMDFDGHDLRQLTRTGSINLSPEWSPDGRGIIFTSYMNRKPDLWAMDFATLRPYPISARPGLNASGRYSPDGKIIALSMSFNGTPKIFTITPQGNIIKMLTSGRGNDISPTWSPDGSTIAYVSDHAGTPQIYITPVSGGESRRLTLQGGNYNTDPKWSPRGDSLAFTARIEGRFQICTIRTDGTDLRVLTRTGSNQDPAWSPDGRMIAFQSNRDGKKLIYIMDSRGETQVPVSPVTGKAPAWSRTGR